MTKYKACDCDPLEYCEHKHKEKRMAKYDQGGGCGCGPYKECDPSCTEYKGDKMGSAWDNYEPPSYDKKPTRCNCDASCGENRYHDVGSSGCRFSSEAEHDAYYGITKSILKEPKRKLSNKYTKEEHQPMKHIYDENAEEPVLESATRPWGIWRVLDVDQGYKVKRLEILPDAAISLQYHNHRSEHWTIVQGEGKVIVDGNIFKVVKGESFFVPKQALHKITNTHLHETLIAIEVQMGEICSEEDIVRC